MAARTPERPQSRPRRSPSPEDSPELVRPEEGKRKRSGAVWKGKENETGRNDGLRPAPVLGPKYSMAEYKEYLKWQSEKNALKEDALEKRELRRLQKSNGQAPPLWSTMPEFAGMTRAAMRKEGASNESSSSIQRQDTREEEEKEEEDEE